MNYKKRLSYAYLFVILIFIFLSNSYFSFEESLIFGGADGKSYFDISKYSPYLSEEPIQPIHAERFFFSYLIGLISKTLFIEIYTLNRIFVIFIIVLINKYIIDFFLRLNKDKYFILLTLLILNFNPYFSRFYIAVPLILNDLIFILGSIICINSFSNKNKKQFFLGLILSSLARQSAAAICLSILFLKIFNNKDKFFLKSSDIFISFIIFLIIYFMGYLYSSNIPIEGTRSEQYFITIFGLFIENKNFKELLIYFIWPLLSYGPLIIYFILLIRKNLSFNKTNYNLNLFILFFSILIVMQPILQGLEVSGKNIIRLCTLAYPGILIFFIINSKKFKIKKITFLFFIILSLIWSSHPTFSIFSYLEKFKF